MASDRPYRKSLQIERVLDELRRYRGTQFHSQVTDILLDMYYRGDFALIVEADATTEIYNSLVEHVQI